ncbi:MAG: tetratricopeptide repeat protein [Proteobacteria bacterium]|nr:tetratricopeptide repeat protein [Pseudomonadota bacterium]MBU1387689.1 tetratricopeptide repeat protein [Pseudomonadota bacterium]MBU1543721.1 tetratricopeptide repeat protein [Pseudomonadota bacterium]MBU2482216.1 tetratricopeptide repeat protein [Pseudomonadota bacterium]
MADKHILIVDDEKEKSTRLAATIKHLGFNQVLIADGADNAWVVLKNKEIECIICAYEMEEMTGLALLKIVRREKTSADIPFFLTDEAFTKIKVIKAGQNGVTGLFVIPYDEAVLDKKIRAAVSRQEEPVVAKAQQTFAQGLKLIEAREYDKAIEVFTVLVNQRENPEYYFNIGYIKTSQGKHSEAIEAFSMATRLDRLFARAYEEMGRVYRLMGDLAKAEEYMQLAAEIYMDTDKIGAAEDVLNELLESGTDSLNVFNTLGVLYRKKGDPQMALNQYKKALKVHPDEPYIYYNIGRLYLDLKDDVLAKQYFTDALKKDPDFEEARQVIKAIDLGIV